MDGHGEVCLEAEAERLWRSGMKPDEIARVMGVDVGWIEEIISTQQTQQEEPEAAPDRE